MLFSDENMNKLKISGKDKHGFRIYGFVDRYSKRKSWTVSLKENKGFYKYDKSKPLNFWFYMPQREDDKVPLKNDKLCIWIGSYINCD